MQNQADNGQPPAGAPDILVVDDHPEITEMLAEALADEGYCVRVAHDGAGALREVLRRRPDLLLLDVMMPQMSGDKVLAQLRQSGHADLPVILMTADRTPERYQGLGARSLVRKPFDILRLTQLVARFLAPAHELSPPPPPRGFALP